MAFNQSENQVSYPSQPRIPEGQKVSLTEMNRPTENTPNHAKWRWLWLGLTIMIMATIVLLASLVFTQFGTLIGYPTISGALAGLLVVFIVEAVTLFRKQNK